MATPTGKFTSNTVIGLKNSPIPPMPSLPDDAKKRFPSLVKYEQELEVWRKKVNVAVFGITGT